VRFTSIFLASSFICSQAFAYAHPLSAANASRWAQRVVHKSLIAFCAKEGLMSEAVVKQFSSFELFLLSRIARILSS
jgi:hypothetical protein